jgi:hypothetical protein
MIAMTGLGKPTKDVAALLGELIKDWTKAAGGNEDEMPPVPSPVATKSGE